MKKPTHKPKKITIKRERLAPGVHQIAVTLQTKRLLRVIGGFLAGFLLIFWTAPLWNPILFPPVQHPRIGVSFSEKRATELGLNWRDNFTALLDDMKLRSFRLMSYWDVHEPTRGNFDFESLDWQMNEAAKRGATVSLAIGLRQPRWPECHEPDWAKDLGGNTWKQALYAYIEVVAKRYEYHPALESWQLENEGMNNWFGECGAADAERLNEEFNLMKKLTKKPVYMSLSDQHGLPVNPPVPDKYGYSVYRTVWSEKTWPYVGYITYPTPIWYHRVRADIIRATTGRDIFIHELQLEPWGPRDTRDLSIDEQNASMSTQQIGDSLYFAREIGVHDIYTWGGEWWYWRKVHGDPSVWNNVSSQFEALR
ncbi:MAG: beta-galactosidase [Candidatus Saccharimonadales bacterium]